MTNRSYILSVAVLGALFALPACSSDKDAAQSAAQAERPVEVLYNEAADALDAKEYQKASTAFEEVERQHPYSQWATKAQLMSAFAAYQDDRYDEAILTLDRFIELHPGNEDIDYAYYLKALAYYEQITDVARDQAMTQNAMEALNTLILRFPDSQYTRDATLKRDLTLDHLAGKEMEIGRYYLNRGQVNAAINRFRTVVRDYQTTTHTPEALERLVESYLTLGLKTEATRVAAVLGYNYPGSKWYEDAYKILDPEMREQIKQDKSFVDKTVESLFKAD
jgi:outer membrane protein assembly factor BamD